MSVKSKHAHKVEGTPRAASLINGMIHTNSYFSAAAFNLPWQRYDVVTDHDSIYVSSHSCITFPSVVLMSKSVCCKGYSSQTVTKHALLEYKILNRHVSIRSTNEHYTTQE